MPDYALVDLALSYDTRAWRLALNISNLADKTYVSCWGSCYYGSTRRIDATLRYKW